MEKEKSECHCGDGCKCKNSNGTVIKLLLVVLFCGVAFVGGLLVRPLLFGKNEDKCVSMKEATGNKIDNEKESLFDVDIAVMETYVSNLRFLDSMYKNSITTDELNGEELLRFAAEKVEKENGSFSLEDLNNVLKKYFGVTVEGKDILCDVCEDVLYKYNAETKTYSYYGKNENGEAIHEHEGGSCFVPVNRIVSVSSSDGINYTVKVKKIFAAGCYVTTAYYASYQDMKEDKVLFDDFDVEAGGVDNFLFENDEYSKKILTYTYVFEKTDNGFIFKSYSFE